MKRAIAIVPLLFLLFTFGCGKEKFPMNKLTKEDFAAISVDGEKTITFDMKRAEIQNVLGEPLFDNEGIQSYGEAKHINEFFTDYVDELWVFYSMYNSQVVQSFEIMNSAYQTPRNITVGDTVKAVKKAYGDNPDTFDSWDGKNGFLAYTGNLLDKDFDWNGKTLLELSDEEKELYDNQIKILFSFENGYVKDLKLSYSY